jgi:hypothetical protein
MDWVDWVNEEKECENVQMCKLTEWVNWVNEGRTKVCSCCKMITMYYLRATMEYTLFPLYPYTSIEKRGLLTKKQQII